MKACVWQHQQTDEGVLKSALTLVAGSKSDMYQFDRCGLLV